MRSRGDGHHATSCRGAAGGTGRADRGLRGRRGGDLTAGPVSVLEALSKSSPESAADLLAAPYPPLAVYCPILASVSAPKAAFLLTDKAGALHGGAAGGG